MKTLKLTKALVAAATLALAGSSEAFEIIPYPADQLIDVNAEWTDHMIQSDIPAGDYDILRVTLPFAYGMSPNAQVIDESQTLTSCKVVSKRITGNSVVFLLELGEFNFDSGWNGCTFKINQNLTSEVPSLTFRAGINVED